MSKLVYQLSKVNTQQQFMNFLEDMITTPKDETIYSTRSGRLRELKTYILESHEIFSSLVAGDLSCEISDGGLDNLKILRVTDKKSNHISEFFLDNNDDRFLVLHTNERSEVTNKIVDELTKDYHHTFDHVWLHSNMLKQLSEKNGNRFKGFGIGYSNEYLEMEEDLDSETEDLKISTNGSLAKRIKTIIEKDEDIKKRFAFNKIRIERGAGRSAEDSIQDDIHNTGYFSVKKGRSIQDHIRLVDIAKKEYHETISRIEDNLIGIKTIAERTLLDGSPFEFEFPTPIKNIDLFLTKIFNSSQPFKLWGIKTKIYDGYFKVMAIDLHTGSPVDFEISKDMMRVYLFKGNCGNIILRLFTNLQIYHDSRTKCVQLN